MPRLKFFLLFAFFAYAVPCLAFASAILYLSPSAGSFDKNQEFAADVDINTADNSINAFSARLVFDKDKLKIISIDTTNSIFKTWIQYPVFSNADGTLDFSSGTPAPGFSGSGPLFTVHFKGIAGGEASAGFAKEVKILLNDGLGTEILGDSAGGVYVISEEENLPPPPPPPSPPPPPPNPDIGPEPNSSQSSSSAGSIQTHNICYKQKCIQAVGESENECQNDSECQEPIFTPPPPAESLIKEAVVAPIKAVTETATVTVETVVNAGKAVKEAVNTPQGEAATKAVSTAGAVVATTQAATAVAFSPFELFLLLSRISGIFLTLVGVKKRTKSWGVVYDAVTKQPLDPAVVTLKDIRGKVVATAVTDIDGRFGFLTDPGIYYLSAAKTNYAFPSKKLIGESDEMYNNLYFGGEVEVKKQGDVIAKNIPMDPLKFDWNEFSKRSSKLMKFYSKFDVLMAKIFDLFFVSGFVIALVAYYSAPRPYNLVILIVYLLLLLLRVEGLKLKRPGKIESAADGSPMSFAILRVMMPGTEVQISSKVADKYGKYFCLVPKGRYYVSVEKKNQDGSYSSVFTSSIIDANKTGIIKEKFKV